jgi:hypothetical protein
VRRTEDKARSLERVNGLSLRKRGCRPVLTLALPLSFSNPCRF